MTWTRYQLVEALEGFAQCVDARVAAKAHLAQVGAQLQEARTFYKGVPGAKRRAMARRDALQPAYQEAWAAVHATTKQFEEYYFYAGAGDFFPPDYVEAPVIRQVAALIAQHRADTVGQAINLLVGQQQYQQAQAAANRRHQQNLRHRQDVANRAILWDMWSRW